MKRLLPIILSIILLTIIGCGSGDSKDTQTHENEPILTSISLSATKLEIEANGIDSSILSVIGYDENNKEMEVEGVKYFISGNEILSPFKTNNPGVYEIVARINNLVTNKIIVTAVSQEVKLAQGTNILEDDELAGVISFDSEKKQLVFTKDEGSKYVVGDFLVTGISANFPTGLLAKVVSSEETGDNIVVTLENAKLTDIVEDGQLSYHVDLKQSGIKRVLSNYKGVSLSKAKRSYPKALETDVDFVLSIDSVIYDGDGNTSTTDDQIRVNGELTIDPGIDITFDIDFFTIEEFAFGVDTNITGNLVLSGDISESFEKEIVIASYIFAPISIPLGNIPIIITPSMDLVVGAKGRVEGKFRCGLSQQATAEVKAGYTSSNGWGGENNFNNDFDFSQPELKGDAGINVYTGAALKIALYSDLIAAGYGKVLVYFKADANINNDPWWCIKGGIESVLGFSGLGLGSFDYSVPIFEKNIVCADYFGSGAFNPDEEVEKGWAKQYEIPTTFMGEGMNNESSLMGVVSNGQDGFITIGSEPFLFSRFFEFNKDGELGIKKFVKRDEDGAEVFHSYGIVKDGNNYIVVGIGGLGIIITKIDGAGNHIWAKTYEASITLSKPNIKKLSDNKFIAYIGSEYVIFDSNANLLSSGSIKYDFDPQDTGEETMFVDIAGGASFGNGYFIVASFGLFPRSVILKYDNNDNLLWSKHVGIPDIDDENAVLAMPTDITAAEDGTFYMIGFGIDGPFISKFDSDGNNAWVRVIDAKDSLFLHEAKLTSDGGVVAVGTLGVEESGLGCVVKISKHGVYAFGKKIGDRLENIELNSICERDDGKMLAAVGYRTISATKQPFIVTMNQVGDVEVANDSTVYVVNLGKNIITNLGFKSGIGGAVFEPNQVSEEIIKMKNFELNINLNNTF